MAKTVIKVIGTVILITSASLMGHIVASEREARVRQLATLLHSLERLETEIVYGLHYLEDAFSAVAQSYPGVSLLYRRANRCLAGGATARDAWLAGLGAVKRASSLTADDLRPLEEMGGVLGVSSAEDQKRHFHLVRREVEVKLTDARARLPHIVKLYRTLGVFGGLTATLLLL